MKKLLIIGGSIIAVFVLIVVLTNKSNEAKLKDNPYGTDQLHPETINLIGNENYDDIILPEELEKKIDAGEDVTAYFFSPTCQYCKQMTPVLMPIVDELDMNVVQYNLLEFSSNAGRYNIEGTPTLIHFKDGVEIDRLYGAASEEYIRQFFSNYDAN